MEEECTADDKLVKDREKGFMKNPRFKGGEYEMMIAELFVILALKKENIRYNLSMEDKSAGKFDDLVFKVLHQGQYICWFLQAIHKEKGEKITWNDLLFKQKVDFYLGKYFESFLDITKSTSPPESCVSRYIIYTPALLDFDNNLTDEDMSCITSGNNSLRFRKVSEEHDMLDTCSYFMYELLAEDFIKYHLRKTSGANDEDIKNFLQCLRFAVGQPTVDELHDILFKKAKEAAEHIDPYKLRNSISMEIRKSFMQPTSDSKHFTEIGIAKIILRVLSDMFKNSCRLDVTFSSYDLMHKIWHTDESVIQISTCSPKLCCNKLINHPGDCKEIFILNFTDFVKVRNIVLTCLPLDEKVLIIVVYDVEENSEIWDETLQSLVKRFTPYTDQIEASNEDKQLHVRKQVTTESKLVLLSKSLLDINMARMPELQKDIVCFEDDPYTFKSLSRKCQYFITDKVVTFQGVPVAFNTLCSEDSMPPFDSHDIETIVSEANMTLVEHATCLVNELKIYIPRDMYVKTLSLYSLDNRVDVIFVIILLQERHTFSMFRIGTSLHSTLSALSERNKNIYPVNIEEADVKFAELCQLFPGKTIHKLKLDVSADVAENVKLQWLQTHGTTDVLFKYINENDSLDVEEIEQKPVAIVAAELGMGKTTLLSHIAEEEKKNHSDRWAINVRLKDVASKLLDLNPSDDISNIAKCLSESFLEGESSLSKHLFQHSLEVTGKFILLLDGYDEIRSKKEREKVRLVLQKLRENSLGQVIITTRLHFKEELELAVPAIAYRLKPLKATQQVTLLAKTWIKNLGISPNEDKAERVHVYARELVNRLSQNVDEGIKSLIGIPLLLTLHGEVYERKCSLFCNMEDPRVLPMIITTNNMLMLYRSFEEKKYEDFCRNELKKGASINSRIMKTISDVHRNLCVELALKELFPYPGAPCDCCLRSKPKAVHLLQVDEIILTIGILQNIGGRGLSFIQRTFAEYFFTIYHLLQMEKCCKKFAIAFKSGFYESRFSMVRLLLDNALATSRIHNAAIANDVETIEKELKRGTSVNLRDGMGRTPCHLAASYGHVVASELLLTRGCNTCIKDGLHKYTPAEVAAKVGKWEICSLFLSKRRYIKLSIKEKCSLFRYLCENGKAEPLKVMLSNLSLCLKSIFQFKKMIHSKDEKRGTGFNIALENGNVEVVRILLDLGLNITGDDITQFRFVFSSNTDVLERQKACFNLLNKKAIVSHCYRIFTEESVNDTISANLLQCLIECDFLLKKVVWLTLLYGKDSDLERVFIKVGEVHDDIVTFILQPFESHDTMLNFASVYGTMESVKFLLKKLESERENIFHYILSPDVKQRSLLHYAVKRNQIKLCDFYIQKVRESGRNVGEYISQKDHLGRTALHWAAYHGHTDMVDFLILKMKYELTPVFERRKNLVLVSYHESWNELKFFEILFQEIMKHGNNLLAYILQTDSAQMNILHILELDDYVQSWFEKAVIGKRIKGHMEDEIFNLFKAVSGSSHSVKNFKTFIMSKCYESRKTDYKKLLVAAVLKHNFEIFKVLTEEIEREGGSHIHFVECMFNSYESSLIELSFKCGSIQILEYILQKIEDRGGNIPESNTMCIGSNIYILQTFVECLLNGKMSSSQLEADVTMLPKDNFELKYSVHGLAKFCDITVVRTYFEIIRRNGESLEYYITRRNKECKTCVHCAAERGRKEVVEYLLEEVEEECEDCSHCFYPDEEGWTLLHSAAVGGNTCLVEFILHKIREYKFNTFAYILQETTGGQSAIHCASSNGHAEVVKMLFTVIEMKSHVLLSNILSKQEYRNILLSNAASHGNIELLDIVVQKCTGKLRKRSVVKSGKQIKKKTRLKKSSCNFCFVFGNYKRSPVYNAIIHDNLQVVQFLFENLATKREKTTLFRDLLSCISGKHRGSPFQYAYIHGAWKCLSYLIHLVTKRWKSLKYFMYNNDQYGKTLLHYSISSGNTRVSTLLMQTMCEEEGEDIFHWSLWSSMSLEEFLQSFLKKRNIELFLFFIRLIQKEKGSILSLRSEQIDIEKSVICYLAKYVDREVLDLFFKEIEKQGGNIFHYLSTPDGEGKVLLEGAVFHKNYSVAEYLIGVIKEKGGDTNDYFRKKDFIRRVTLEATEELENEEEYYFQENNSHPRDIFENKKEVLSPIEYLHDYLRKCHADALSNDMTEVANLLSHVAECLYQNFLINVPPGINELTKIRLAISTGNIEMLDSIFSTIEVQRKGIALCLDSPDYVNAFRNAFHIAALSGDKKVMEFLFRKVTDESVESCSLVSRISRKDVYGRTPLYYAVEHGNVELVKFLLKILKV